MICLLLEWSNETQQIQVRDCVSVYTLCFVCFFLEEEREVMTSGLLEVAKPVAVEVLCLRLEFSHL